jgi:hypothetical protein
MSLQRRRSSPICVLCYPVGPWGSSLYELWESATIYKFDYLGQHFRYAARKRADDILTRGEGLAYFVKSGVPYYMMDRMLGRYSTR